MNSIIIANWKMNLSLEDALSRANQLDNEYHSSQFLLSVPAPYLAYFAKILRNIDPCAQDVSVFDGFGPYTGEYSANMLASCAVKYAIIGHSERRTLFKETNKIVKAKATNCLKSGITPIICVGETLEARKNNSFLEVILDQILESVPDDRAGAIIIAYEPVWAIGSSATPTIEEISEMLEFIRASKAVALAKNIKLVYGGSVNSSNYKAIKAIPSCNGVILGSAALDQKELISILN